MNKTYTLKSPAKINIGLRVLSKRADGYHNIETIFYPVKLYDKITLKIGKLPEKAKENKIFVKTSTGNNLNDKKNICYKAVELFFENFKIENKYKISITINKSIPIGAGLGGGSSNAAAVLKVLTKHFAPAKNIETRLRRIALQLGSDVPFFLLQKPAYATGRGEKLISLPQFKIKYKILIVNPGIHVSTPWAYNQSRITNDKLPIRKTLKQIKKFTITEKVKFVNDFERVIFKKYPQIKKLKLDMLKFGAEIALMSGSGSTVYGFFSKEKIKAAKKYFSGLKYSIFVS